MLSASTYVLGCERHHALVVGFLEGCPDDLEGFLAYRLAMQEGIDLLVGHPVGCFVRLARCEVFQIGRWYFLDQ